MMKETPQRRFEFDWLRVLAILIVYLYHSTRFFNLGDWHVKNAHTYLWVEMWNVFAMTWLMPLFFIISGASLFYALGKTSSFKKFYADKFLRLMIPVVVATVSHSAVQVYLERVTHGRFLGSFFSFLPEYLNGVYIGIGEQGNFAFAGMHLWYLLFLYVYSLMCYSLFVWFKNNGRTVLDRITTFLALPGLMFLCFPLPLFLMKAFIPGIILSVGAGAWGFLYYLWFLVAGFLIVSSELLQKNIIQQRWISLVLGICLSVAYLYMCFGPSHPLSPDGYSHWSRTIIYFFSAWCWLFAILGFGIRLLAFDHPWLPKANEGVLPFYILHQSVLVVIGFFVVRWEINALLKWGVVFTSALLTILILYSGLIKRSDLLRFLFGMKTSRPFFDIFRKNVSVLILHLFYAGLIAIAIMTAAQNRTPMPLAYDPATDILLTSDSITARSVSGVDVVYDSDAVSGRAIRFSAGANPQTQLHPNVFVEMQFSAPAGLYQVWLRGKSDDNEWTDSVWLQVDDHIETQAKSVRMGNWRDIYPAGVYAWAGDGATPVPIALTTTGDHNLRIQPRQTPHRIDQVWFSRYQVRIPDTVEPIR